MKVAYLVGGLPFGGIECWLYDLIQEYRRNGLVASRVFNLSGTGLLLPEYLKAGIEVVCAVQGNIRAIASHRLDTTLTLRRLLKEFKPDLVHTMHFTANHHGRLACLGLGMPVITHVHNIKHERRPLRRLSDKLLSRATTMYLAVSGAVADVVETDHNMAKRPVKVLYNALNPERLTQEPLDFAAAYGLEGPVVLAVGRYVPQKNLDLLMRAVALMRGRGIGAELVLVGEGPERPVLEALRDELGLGRHAVLTGFRPDVAAFYKGARIFAMPSDFEGFLTAHLEAMYCGLPAVLSEYVPSLEIARDACLVCRRDPEDIADAIGNLLQDKDLYARLAANAERLAKPRTMENYARTLYGIYETVLAGACVA